MSDVVYFNSDGTIDVTGDEAVTRKNLEDLRSVRNSMLTETDWTQGADSPLGDADKTAWATYRQALRDITDTYSSLDTVVWPTKP